MFTPTFSAAQSTSKIPIGWVDPTPSADDPEEVECFVGAANEWFPDPEPFEDFDLLEQIQGTLPKPPSLLPSRFTEFAFRMPRADGFGYENFSFDGRRHMRRPYDTPAKRVLLVCGRQVEKCQNLSSAITTATGDVVDAKDIRIGSKVICLDVEKRGGTRFTSGEVIWISGIVKKASVRITTRQGRELEIAKTHPLRIWDGWAEAGQVSIGDRVAGVRFAGKHGSRQVDPHRIELTAFMIGDGCTTQPSYSFSGRRGPVVARFKEVATAIGHSFRVEQKENCEQLYIHKDGPLYGWLEEDGLAKKYSYEKVFPAWAFELTQDGTALLLNRLWSTDGHIKQDSVSKYSIEYATTSKRLAKQVQSLLWRFGVPTSIRKNQPSYIRTNGELARLAYILRVETQAGITNFLTKIGALGKSEKMPLPIKPPNNNRDTLPLLINDLIRRIVDSRGSDGRMGPYADGSLRSAGLRETLKYPPTQCKIEQYVAFFRADARYDQRLVEELAWHIDSDVYWDEVERIEEIGEQDCIDFEVAEHHNYLVDGIVTHNSTLLGNITLCYSCLVPAFKTLYVSPSATQTKTFSVDRIKEPIETSEVLRAYTTNMLAQNVFEKQFVNRSKITLRYAFLNADRCAVGTTRAHFVGGRVATLDEINASPATYLGQKVWSVDPVSLEFVKGTLVDVVDQGVRPVFRVTLEGGAETTCTANQPFLTWDGWKELQQLPVGAFVGVPHRAPHGEGNSILNEEYRLIGYLLGDGCCTTFNGVAFFSGIPTVMAEFQRCAKAVGATLGRLTNSNKKKWVHSQTKRQGIYGGRNGYKARLKSFGLIGKNHETKRIPKEFFSGNREQIAHLLGAIYATDGWACVTTTSSGVQYEIGYASNSKGLCQDLKVLLLRFGVHAVLKQKKPSTKGARGSFTLSIRNAPSIHAFCAAIIVLGKEDEFGLVAGTAEKVRQKKDDYDRIPLSYQQLRTYLLARYGLTTHSAWEQHKIQLRPGNVLDSVGRRVLLSIASKLGDVYLHRLAESVVGWARITSIEELPAQQTYDLTVETSENYLVDGVFIHNTRGIPAWMLQLDELQDILHENVPVIEQCTSHAPEKFKRLVYAGTPKSLDNTIEYYRSHMSTQGEWVVPCDHHGGETGAYWNVLGEKNIGKKGLSCEKCGNLLNPMHDRAQWARMVESAAFESYRVPQIMVPWKPWDDILLDYERYPRDKFYNEVLGISYDSGTRPITAAQLMDTCDPKASMALDRLTKYKRMSISRGMPIYAGIDWGSGSKAYTVITLGMYDGLKFRVFYMHRFVGEDIDPAVQIERISEIINDFGVTLVGCDWGFGFAMNDTLIRRFGANRVWKYHYMARCRKKVEFDGKLLRFKVHRTEVMSDLFNAIKRKQILFPRWEEFKLPYGQDILNIFAEENESLHQIQYSHSPDNTDDTFHSILYCLLVSMIKQPRPDIIAPRKENPEQGGGLISTYSGPTNQG